MTPEDHLTLTSPKPCPGCNSTGKHRPFCPEVYAMTFAPQPRPTLASLTDAQVRALLGSTDDADIEAACEAGLMKARHSYDDEGEDCEMVTFTDDARRINAEAQRIADGLSDEQARHIAGEPPLFSAVAEGMAERGLLCFRVDRSRTYLEPTSLGSLVLALRERSKTPESSADELERLAQEHEDEEYRYRESQGEERRGK